MTMRRSSLPGMLRLQGKTLLSLWFSTRVFILYLSVLMLVRTSVCCIDLNINPESRVLCTFSASAHRVSCTVRARAIYSIARVSSYWKREWEGGEALF